jgi:hypothetical protein
MRTLECRQICYLQELQGASQGSHSSTTMHGAVTVCVDFEDEPQAYFQHSQMWQPLAAARNIPNADRINNFFIMIGLLPISVYLLGVL